LNCAVFIPKNRLRKLLGYWGRLYRDPGWFSFVEGHSDLLEYSKCHVCERTGAGCGNPKKGFFAFTVFLHGHLIISCLTGQERPGKRHSNLKATHKQ
jgi:hypothetical protein